MQLEIISSGSVGNCYILRASNGDNIIIEAGINFSSKKNTGKTILKAMGHDLSKTKFCLVTHAHGDHGKGAAALMAAGIDIVMSEGTHKHLKGIDYRFIKIKHGGSFNRGGFHVNAFKSEHDCPGGEPLGFLIYHKECGLTLFLTDTKYVSYKFPGLQNIIIEANYCENIMSERFDRASLPLYLKDRIIKSHLSLSECQNILRQNDLSSVNNIVLIHLSDQNSDAKRFKKTIYEQTLKTVTIAEAGVTIPFNSSYFDF